MPVCLPLHGRSIIPSPTSPVSINVAHPQSSRRSGDQVRQPLTLPPSPFPTPGRAPCRARRGEAEAVANALRWAARGHRRSVSSVVTHLAARGSAPRTRKPAHRPRAYVSRGVRQRRIDGGGGTYVRGPRSSFLAHLERL
ncbi:hypothetical protein ZWY2020_015040 [Hordeum vulgare]|nr:hypothetical protein ZWY2020_015040 [Hordeum vulgare]